MGLYTTKEICINIKGVTTRTLIDLVEKGIVEPAKGSEGRGEHRLYDEDNILDIMVAVSLRGMFPSYLLQAILATLKKHIKGTQFMVLTHRNRSKKLPPGITFVKKGEAISKEDLKNARDYVTSKKMDTGPVHFVDTFASVVVDLEEMQAFIKNKF